MTLYINRWWVYFYYLKRVITMLLPKINDSDKFNFRVLWITSHISTSFQQISYLSGDAICLVPHNDIFLIPTCNAIDRLSCIMLPPPFSHARCYWQYPLFLSWDTLCTFISIPLLVIKSFPYFVSTDLCLLNIFRYPRTWPSVYPINSRDYHR